VRVGYWWESRPSLLKSFKTSPLSYTSPRQSEIWDDTAGQGVEKGPNDFLEIKIVIIEIVRWY
jgi:hypothetical protein